MAQRRRARVTYLHLKGDHHARIAHVLQDDPRADKAADDGVPAYQFGEARLAYAAAQQEALSGLADPRHPLRIQCALKMCEIATAGALGAEFALEAWEAATRVYEVVCHALNEAEDEDDESRSGVLTSSKTAENPTIHLVQLLRDQLGLIEAQWSLDQANLIEDDNDDDDDSSEGTGVDSKKSRRSMTSKQRSPGAGSILSDGNAATMSTLKLRDSVRGIKRVITSAQTRDKNSGTVTLFSRAETAARLRRAGTGKRRRGGQAGAGRAGAQDHFRVLRQRQHQVGDTGRRRLGSGRRTRSARHRRVLRPRPVRGLAPKRALRSPLTSPSAAVFPDRARRYLNYDGFISFAADFRIAPPSPDKAVVVARPLVAQAKAAAEKGDAGAEMDLQAKAAALMSPHDCLMTAEQLRVIFTLSAFACTRPELAVFALDDPSLLASNVPAEPVAAPSPGSPTKQGADSNTQPLEDDLELARKSEAVNRGLTFDQANCALARARRAPRARAHFRALPMHGAVPRLRRSVRAHRVREERPLRPQPPTAINVNDVRALSIFHSGALASTSPAICCAGGTLARSHAAGRRRHVEAALFFARAARGVRGGHAPKKRKRGHKRPRCLPGARQDPRASREARGARARRAARCPRVGVRGNPPLRGKC